MYAGSSRPCRFTVTCVCDFLLKYRYKWVKISNRIIEVAVSHHFEKPSSIERAWECVQNKFHLGVSYFVRINRRPFVNICRIRNTNLRMDVSFMTYANKHKVLLGYFNGVALPATNSYPNFDGSCFDHLLYSIRF